MLAHGIAGGVLNELQGGKFGHGFISAGLTKFASSRWISQIEGGNWYHVLGRTAIAAAVGGTVSKITGGKFANGAQTAAYAHLFNEESRVIGGNSQAAQMAEPLTQEQRIAILKAHGVGSDELWDAYLELGSMKNSADPQLYELIDGLSTNKALMKYEVYRLMGFMEPDVQSELLKTIGKGALDTITTAGGSAPVVRKLLNGARKALVNAATSKAPQMNSHQIIQFYSEQYNLNN